MNTVYGEKEELFSVRVVVLEKIFINGSYSDRFAVVGLGNGIEIFFTYHDAILRVIEASAKALLRR